MQLTALLPVVTLTVLEVIFDVGMFCGGPADPWNFIDGVATTLPHAIYWIPCAVYSHISPSAHQTLRAQVSTCLYWAFSMPQYRIRFLMHQLVCFDFSAF